MVFFIAGAYGWDPRDPMRPAELLALTGLYSDPAGARVALDGAGKTVAEHYVGSKLQRDEALAVQAGEDGQQERDEEARGQDDPGLRDRATARSPTGATRTRWASARWRSTAGRWRRCTGTAAPLPPAERFRPTLDLGFAPSVRVRDLTPGQEIDQVLMVRASDARRVVLGDRTGSLEAAPCQIAAGIVRARRRDGGAAWSPRTCARCATPSPASTTWTTCSTARGFPWTGWRPTCAR